MTTETIYRVGDHVAFTDDSGELQYGEITDTFSGPVTRETVYVIDGDGYYGSQLTTVRAITIQTLAAELAEVRDELHELAVTFRRHQAKAILRDVDDASEPSFR